MYKAQSDPEPTPAYLILQAPNTETGVKRRILLVLVGTDIVTAIDHHGDAFIMGYPMLHLAPYIPITALTYWQLLSDYERAGVLIKNQ